MERKAIYNTPAFWLLVIALIVVMVLVMYKIYMKLTAVTTGDLNNVNVQAFLATVRYSENKPATDEVRYRTIFTGALFTDFTDHPRTVKCAGSLCSDAAGAYQILSTTWDEVKGQIGANDFTPANQDLAALQLISNRGALDDVKAGNFEAAVDKVNKEWASLPGSPYGQPVNTLADLQNIYNLNGGVLTA